MDEFQGINLPDDDEEAAEYIQERLLELQLGVMTKEDILLLLSLYMEYLAMTGQLVTVVLQRRRKKKAPNRVLFYLKTFFGKTIDFFHII